MTNKKMYFLFLSFFVFFSVAPMTAAAQEAVNKNQWQFSSELYLWGATIEGTTGSKSDLKVDFEDIFDNLEMAFMGVFGARKGKWEIMADIIYLDVEDSTTVGSGTSLDAEVSAWIITPAVGYNLLDSDRGKFSVLAGARYLYIKPELELGSLRASDSNDYWDGIMGIKGYVNLTEKWYLPYVADIGTGQTDLSWQLLGGIGYRFNKRFHVNAGYRYLRFDFDSDEALDDLEIHGPFAGAKFDF